MGVVELSKVIVFGTFHYTSLIYFNDMSEVLLISQLAGRER